MLTVRSGQHVSEEVLPMGKELLQASQLALSAGFTEPPM